MRTRTFTTLPQASTWTGRWGTVQRMSVARPVSRETMVRVPNLPSRDLQELWFATRRRNWRTLVVMPAAAGNLSALAIAKALGEVGGFIRMSPVHVINAEGLDLS